MQYILILLLVLTSVYAKQSDFSIIIDKPFNDALFDITQDYDREISAVGFSQHYSTSKKHSAVTYKSAFDYLSSLSSEYGTQVHLVKVDKYANITINKATQLSRFSKAVAVVKTPTNGYFVGGYTLDGSLIILKMDYNGNIIFNKTFGTKNHDKMSNLILLADGGVLSVGTSSSSRGTYDNVFKNGLGLNDIFVTRFSKDGRELWSKKYGTVYDDQGIDAAEANDGSIVVLSTTNDQKNQNVTLMRITENGDKIWLKHYKEDDKVTPYKIIRLRDNNFLVSLSQQNSVFKEQVRLLKIDIQKNVLIDKTIHTTYSSALKDIKEYSDGKLIGVGYVKDSYNTDALVMILDSNLDLLTQEHYGEENYDIFNAVTILNNSQAAACGINTNENSQESNMWITKLNRDGTLAQVSAKIGSFYEELTKLFKPEIDAKKLLIKQDLTIEFIDKALYFKVGKYALTQEQKTFLDKFSKKLIPFMNRYKENITSLEINGHTSSEWGGTTFTNNYLKNEKLSMNRSYSTLSYIFKAQSKPTQIWLSKILRGSGFSYSKKVMLNGMEDKEKSRRVTFKVILQSNGRR